jgi:S1-C subfamily serine protease
MRRPQALVLVAAALLQGVGAQALADAPARTAMLERALQSIVVLEAPPGPSRVAEAFPTGSPFAELFPEAARVRPGQIGTATVIDAERGLIVTADFVTGDNATLTAKLTDGETREARLVARDELVGLAVLQIASGGLQALPWAGREPAVGEEVFAVGSPYLLGPMAMRGMIAGAARPLPDEQDWGFDTRVIFADVQIHKGMGGGPLLDAEGRVVGLLMAQFGGIDRVAPLGVALLGTDIRTLIDQLARGEPPVRGWLGIDLETLLSGLYVTDVAPNSPAAAAGVQVNDIITAVDGQAIARAELTARVARAAPGTRMQLTVSRERPPTRRGREPPPPEQLTLEVTVGTRPR